MLMRAALLSSSLLLATPALADVPNFYCGTMDTVGDTLATDPAFTVQPPKSRADLSSYDLYYENGTFGFISGGDGYAFKVQLVGREGEGYVIAATKDKKLRWTLTPREGNRLHIVGYLFPEHDDADQGKKDANGYTIMIPDGVACTGPAWPGGRGTDAAASTAAAAAGAASGGGALRDVIARAFFTDAGEAARLRDTMEIRAVDLNGDGRNEVIASVDDPAWCGSAGCEYQVFTMEGDKPKLIGGFLGFGLAPGAKKSGGWLTLTLDSRNGPKRLAYKGGKYQ